MAFPKELQIYLQEKLLRTCALIGGHEETSPIVPNSY